MIQLVIIGAILYSILSILTNLKMFKGLARVLTIVNRVLIVLAIIIVVVKTGIIRLVANFVSLFLIRTSEFLGSLF